MKKEAACSSETLATTNKTRMCHNQEDYNLNSHCCENLKSRTEFLFDIFELDYDIK
jgi:hypothetical protein